MKKSSADETQNNKDKGKKKCNPGFFSLPCENLFWRDFYITFGRLKNDMKNMDSSLLLVKEPYEVLETVELKYKQQFVDFLQSRCS